MWLLIIIATSKEMHRDKAYLWLCCALTTWETCHPIPSISAHIHFHVFMPLLKLFPLLETSASLILQGQTLNLQSPAHLSVLIQ